MGSLFPKRAHFAPYMSLRNDTGESEVTRLSARWLPRLSSGRWQGSAREKGERSVVERPLSGRSRLPTRDPLPFSRRFAAAGGRGLVLPVAGTRGLGHRPRTGGSRFGPSPPSFLRGWHGGRRGSRRRRTDGRGKSELEAPPIGGERRRGGGGGVRAGRWPRAASLEHSWGGSGRGGEVADGGSRGRWAAALAERRPGLRGW